MIRAAWTLLYRGVDITSDVDPMAISVTYTDKLHGEVDEIEVTVQDSDGRWRGPWCPEHGDVMQLWIGREGGALVYAGEFELDEPEIEVGRGGDTMTIRGLAAPITAPLRTEKTKEFEDKTAEDIFREVAGDAGLGVEGSFNETTFRRRTQTRMRPLEFLTELGEDTDHYVSVRGRTVQVHKVDDIDGAAPAATFRPDHRDFIRATLRFQSEGTFSEAKTTHLHEEEKRLVEGVETDERVKTGDTLRLVERADDEAQATLKAKGRLHQANRNRRSGRLELVGRADMVAGVTVDLEGLGKFDGRYVVDSSSHSLTRGGYTTSLALKEARQ